MRSDDRRRASTSIGALTRKDCYREAALTRKIDDAYRSLSVTSSARGRRRKIRAARRHERALVAQRRRPQSLLTALALSLLGLLAAIIVTRASVTLALIVAALLVLDLRVLRWRRNAIRRT
ncbi:MAG: hypothetical protein M3Q30_08710 [Actinomycetota bacterium]|nr:hypothetical protein [Actinomycetota bacterium]